MHTRAHVLFIMYISDTYLCQYVLLIDRQMYSFKGTMSAAVQLVKSAGADVIECLVIIELTSLGGRDKLPGIPVHSFIQYDK